MDKGASATPTASVELRSELASGLGHPATTDLRSAADIAAEVANVEGEIRSLRERLSNLKRDLGTAKIAEADHPWLGKRVTRSETNWRGAKTLVGTVKVFTRDHRAIRGTSYGFEIGEPFVVSDTGKTAWRFLEWNGRNLWSLVDGDAA